MTLFGQKLAKNPICAHKMSKNDTFLPIFMQRCPLFTPKNPDVKN